MRDPKEEDEDAVTLFCERMQSEPWKATEADWDQMQRSSIRTTDSAQRSSCTGRRDQFKMLIDGPAGIS